jgi:murein tripeptide amidase MpaA
MKISSNFDGGSIRVVDIPEPGRARLALRNDTNARGVQWFHFRASGVRKLGTTFEIENASESRWADGWYRYRVSASYDRSNWFRLPTEYDGKVLTIRHKPELDAIYYAYAVPYSRERDRNFLARSQLSPRVALEVLGESLNGEDLDLLIIGEPDAAKPAIWVIARQHPGETQGAFAVEGLVERLIDEADAVAREVLARATFYVVANMNPDGSRLGNHRCNSAGIDLNRAWTDASMEASPEVFLVRERMRRSGVAICLDLHAAEREPFVWGVRTPGIPSWNERRALLSKRFEASLKHAAPDYQPERHNLDNAPGTDPLAMAISWTSEILGSLGLIVEFPFLDTEDGQDGRLEWSTARSHRFGSALVDSVYAVLVN